MLNEQMESNKNRNSNQNDSRNDNSNNAARDPGFWKFIVTAADERRIISVKAEPLK